MRSTETTVLGLDVGGTSSRAVLTDLSGRALGSGEAAGGNPNSHPPERAAEQVALAARAALSGADPRAVRVGVLGMAGVSKMADAEVTALFERAWSSLGLSCPMRVVSDSEVAFAAGTPSSAGTVLIAGTGSIAGRVEQHRLVTTAGGYGWLLGDEGSAFWLGREAVRRALRDLAGTPDALTSRVLDELLDDRGGGSSDGGNSPGGDTTGGDTTGGDTAGGAEDLRNRVISAVNAAPPIQLAELAPLVTAAARSDIASAVDIVERAARLLADTAEETRRTGERSPIVLAGSLTTGGNPVGTALRAELAERGHPEPRAAGPGAPGAAWLAARELLDEEPAARLHAQMFS